MARKLRIQHPGAVYRVMNREDRREPIFAVDADRHKFLGGREEDLRARLKVKSSKVELAQELRSQATMPLAWIEQRLCLGSRRYLTWSLQRRGENSLGRSREPYDNTIKPFLRA
jgi:hypothetical protein